MKKNGVSRGTQSLWLRVSNRGEKRPVGTRFCAAKSSVLYLLRPLTLERGCHRTGQTVSCGSRRTDICRHGRLADIRSSGVGDAAKRRLKTEAVLHRRGVQKVYKARSSDVSPKAGSRTGAMSGIHLLLFKMALFATSNFSSTGLKAIDIRFHFIVVVQHLLSNDCSSHCRNTLLPINQNLFARGLCSVLQLHIRVLPYNDVSYWKSLIQRIN